MTTMKEIKEEKVQIKENKSMVADLYSSIEEVDDSGLI